MSKIREMAIEWFFAQSKVEKENLKEKHYPNTPIQFSSQWGYHFTFGQIEEMYKAELEQALTQPNNQK